MSGLQRKKGLRRTGPPKRRTPMPRGKGLARGTSQLRRTPIAPVSAKRKAEHEASRPVVAEVYARDGRCLLDATTAAGRCFGPATPHHLLKAGQGGAWALSGLVQLCSSHNGWVEDHPDDAHRLGLVVRRGETTADAWERMRGAGLVDYGPEGRGEAA